MARDAGNRREIGVLWGVDGLVSLLQSNGSLKLKEVAAAALWLVSCDTDNAIRVALKVSAMVYIYYTLLQAVMITMISVKEDSNMARLCAPYVHNKRNSVCYTVLCHVAL
jgi:hypothetical protein